MIIPIIKKTYGALFYSLKIRLVIFLAVFGPATITAMADNDAAGVATFSLVGAKFGYSILFVLFFVTILLALTQEMGIRMGIVTGKGLGDLIRERYGIKISIFTFIALFIANIGTTIANFAALKVTASMFHIPVFPMILGIILISFLFISKGNYKTNQYIFLISSIFYFLYILSAIKSNPDWGLAVKSTFIPTDIKLTKEFIFASIAVVGTTVTPWGQFFIQSYINDKKISSDKLKFSQIETYFGAFLTNLFAFFMILATAATLYIRKIQLVSGEQAALAIAPFAGEMAGLLFGVGILNAGFMGIVIVSLSTAYAFSEFFGVEGSLNSPFDKGKSFYILFLLQLVIAAVVVLLPTISLFKIVLFTQSLNAMLLPIVFYFLLKLINNKDLMGRYVNTTWYNYFAIISSIVIVAASVFTFISYFI